MGRWVICGGAVRRVCDARVWVWEGQRATRVVAGRRGDGPLVRSVELEHSLLVVLAQQRACEREDASRLSDSGRALRRDRRPGDCQLRVDSLNDKKARLGQD